MATSAEFGFQKYRLAPSPVQNGFMRPVYHVAIKEDERGWTVARCIEIPAAITQGRSKDEAIRRSFDAIASILDATGVDQPEFVVLATEG